MSNHGGILFKSSVKHCVKPFKFTAHTFEYICITNGRNSITYAANAIYRPPPLQVNGVKTNDFLAEIDSFFTELNLLPMPIMALGDFNVHFDSPEKSETRSFMSTLSSIDLYQYVLHPTHKNGHTIDLVITRNSERDLINSCRVQYMYVVY